MLAALNRKEAHSKQVNKKYNDVPSYKIGDLVMIRNFDKKSNWDTKYVSNFRVLHLIVSRQLEDSNPTGRIRELICVHTEFPSDHIVSSIPDEQVFGRWGKYINDPWILKEVAIIAAFLYEHFP